MAKVENLKKQKAFTLIEILIYLSITSMIVVAVGGLLISTFDARRQLQSSEAIQHNARFMVNFIANRVHNVAVIDDVRPDPEQVIFYTSTSTRFSLLEEEGNLIYYFSEDTGSGFPSLASSTSLQVNSGDVVLSNFVLTPIEDNFDNINRGLGLNFTLTTATTSDPNAYLQKDFDTVISIR